MVYKFFQSHSGGFEMKIIEGDLILKENTVFKEDIKVNGNILCEGGPWNINALDINALDIDAWDINALDINARNINAWDINAWDIDALDISFCAVAIAYKTFKCKTWKAGRDNFVIKCLDSEIVGEQVK